MKLLVPSLIASLLALSGCTSSGSRQFTEKTFENMYLRGVFTWWEADESFKLTLIEDGLYFATAKLIADGQPYDFKFSDADWTPEYSCGSLQAEGQVLVLKDEQVAKCEADSGNFQFTPSETGTYEFYINVAAPLSPRVYIQRSN